MVDFALSPEQAEIQKLAAKFAQNEMLPAAPKYDKSGEFPHDVLKKAHENGLMNLSIPQEYGGMGLGIFDTCLVVEEFAAACTGITSSIFANELALGPIIIGGSAEAKERFLKPFTADFKLASFGLTEPNAGSDAMGLKTQVKKEGDGYTLNGVKQFITNAPHAALFTIFATHDPSKKHKGLSCFVVEKGTKGLSVGKEEDKLGQRCSPVAEVRLEDVHVPKENLVGEEMKGAQVCLQTLDRSRPAIGALGVGVARAALENSVKYSTQRQQFGVPIASFQAIQFKIAEMAKDLQAARWLVWHAAWMVDRGERASLFSSMAKCFAADVAMAASTEAVQVHGGYGYIKEFPVEKLMRDAKLLQIYEGTNEIQRLVIAREILEAATGKRW
jgi:acyl-CoA dehydrogenase